MYVFIDVFMYDGDACMRVGARTLGVVEVVDAVARGGIGLALDLEQRLEVRVGQVEVGVRARRHLPLALRLLVFLGGSWCVCGGGVVKDVGQSVIQ